MAIDPPAEVLRLRTALRELVALSTIPVAWVGRGPPAIAAELADVLVGSLHLDFAFVRLCDPNGGDAVEVTRGSTWKAFPEWLERHLAVVGQFSRKEIIPDVGGDAGSCRGIVIPVGVDAESGLIAAACDRTDFPTEIDQLLLSVAANHAATAFQNARLIHERRSAEQALRQSEQELRQARDELEMKVAERTAELRRSEAYLAEAQRLTHTGSWAWSPVSVEPLYWSEEIFRIFGLDPQQGLPTSEIFWERVHPEDRDSMDELMRKAVREKTEYVHDHRIVLPDGTVKHIHAIGHPVLNRAGDVVEFVGTAVDVTERKRAEEELRAAETRFRTYVDHATDALFVHDEQGNIVDVNRQACESLGYTREELIGMAPSRFDSGVDAAFMRWINERLEAGEICAFEASHRRKDGTVFPVEVRVRSFWHGGHRFGLALARDITERKRAEEERQAHLWFMESMDRVNRAMQGTNDLEQMMGALLDAVLSIFACDRAWVSYPCEPDSAWWRVVMERTRPEFPGVFALGGRDLPMAPQVAEVYRALRASDGPVRWGPVGHTVPGPTAVRFKVQSQIAMALYPKVDRPYTFGLHQCSYPRVWTPQEARLFQEIGRRLADALTTLLMFRHLQDSEARLEDAQRIAHVGYWARDLDTDRLTWSDETYRIFGLPPQERTIDVAGLQKLIHQEDRHMVRAAAAALGGGARYDVEFRVVRPGGEVRIVHSQSNVMRDEAGRPRRMFGTVQDITERRRAEEALREAQAELAHVTRVLTLGEMTASIAHEVNQPLAGVTTNGNAGLRWLARDPPNLEEARECLQRIIRDGNRASEVIARMRTFARKATPQKAPLAINDVIAEVLALADSELRRHRVALHTDLAAGLPPVWGDRVQVQQVLLNLVLNGVEAMRGVTDRPRALLVRSQPEEAEAIRIAVQDAGTGIAPQDLERVFTAFYTTKPAGLGMGLAISRSIVEAHGGRLWATPNDGPGATVQFTLPTGGEPVS